MGVSLGNLTIYHGAGCTNCNFTGFWGRLAIYEILFITEPIKRLIMKKAAASEIKREAVKLGMRSLRQDGWQKVAAGLTTPAEILEVAQDDDGFSEESGEGQRGFSVAIKSEEVLRKGVKEPKIDDRRVFMRLDASVTVCYRIVKTPALEEASPKGMPDECTVTKNISAGGLAFFIEESIPVASILELRIELPDHKEPIDCLARILRLQAIEGTGLFEAGVCFLDLSSRDRQLIDRFVDKERK
jgi:hypothetical protein